ncbi:DNA replication protein, partial [Pasteurella caecimuris]|nr:DNA replication protein [Pasteurella caecimuris]
MKASESLRLIGQPIAYYKGLTKVLGGATATILFSQLYYWSDKTDNPLGVYKTLDELMDETGLTER